MKQFTTAIEESISEDEAKVKAEEREAAIVALMAKDKTLKREYAEAEVDGESYVEFEIDGRVLRSYKPHDGQMIFMLASMGKGQQAAGRFAAIVNVMLESLRGDDNDYLTGRLLTSRREDRLPPKKIEEIFAFLVEEWFRADDGADGAPVSDRG